MSTILSASITAEPALKFSCAVTLFAAHPRFGSARAKLPHSGWATIEFFGKTKGLLLPQASRPGLQQDAESSTDVTSVRPGWPLCCAPPCACCCEVTDLAVVRAEVVHIGSFIRAPLAVSFSLNIPINWASEWVKHDARTDEASLQMEQANSKLTDPSLLPKKQAPAPLLHRCWLPSFCVSLIKSIRSSSKEPELTKKSTKQRSRKEKKPKEKKERKKRSKKRKKKKLGRTWICESVKGTRLQSFEGTYDRNFARTVISASRNSVGASLGSHSFPTICRKGTWFLPSLWFWQRTANWEQNSNSLRPSSTLLLSSPARTNLKTWKHKHRHWNQTSRLARLLGLANWILSKRFLRWVSRNQRLTGVNKAGQVTTLWLPPPPAGLKLAR